MSKRERFSTTDSLEFHQQMTLEIKAFKECVHNLQFGTVATNLSMHDMVDLASLPMNVLSKCAEDFSSVTAGLYAVLLRRWSDILSDRTESQLLVVDSDEMFRKSSVLPAVFQFIGVSPLEVQISRKNSAADWANDGGTSEMMPETSSMLQAFFLPFNKLLWGTVAFSDGHTPSWIFYFAESEVQPSAGTVR